MKGGGADFTCLSVCVSKSYQKSLNIHVGYADIFIPRISLILDILLSFFKNFFLRGGGGAKFKFALGRQIPSLRH